MKRTYDETAQTIERSSYGMTHRILLAGLPHETNTFADGTTGLSKFECKEGEQMLNARGDSSPLGGFIDVADSYGWEIIPALDCRTMANGMVEDEAVEWFWDRLKQYIEGSLEKGLSAIFLILHGAMVSESFDDVEGELLRRLRLIKGLESMPIYGVIDLHANFTAAMAQHADCLIAYKENPHIDAYDAARRAAILLQRCLETGKRAVTRYFHPPIVLPPTGTATAAEPMLSLERLGRELENENPSILAVNILAGFSHADIADSGISFTIITLEKTDSLESCFQRLTDIARNLCECGLPSELTIDEAMELLPGLKPPVVIAEPSDNIGGGAPGDGTWLLRALLEKKIPKAAMIINDPDSVAKLERIEIGQRAKIDLGGKGSRLDAGPLSVEVKVLRQSDGLFFLEDRQSHLAAAFGNRIEMGRSVLVEIQNVLVLITSRPTPPFDLGQWRCVGVNPEELGVLVVKAAVAHRRTHDPFAGTNLAVDTPGPCSSNLRQLSFKKIKRPIFPLDSFDTMEARWNPDES